MTTTSCIIFGLVACRAGGKEHMITTILAKTATMRAWPRCEEFPELQDNRPSKIFPEFYTELAVATTAATSDTFALVHPWMFD